MNRSIRTDINNIVYAYKVYSLFAWGLAVYLISLYPDLGWLGISVLLVSSGILLWDYKAGFMLLAVLLPVLDFGTWTGNILFGEYDILYLLVIGVLFWHKKPHGYLFQHELFFFAVGFWFLVCCAVGFWSFRGSSSIDDIYQSPFNSLRVGKGFLAAWLVWYVIRDELATNAKTICKWLAVGVLFGLLLLSLAIMWERHIFSALFGASDLYGLAGTILDFSSRYRVTGMFSGMHVGGTALDGYLVSVVPLVFYVFTRQNKKWHALGVMLIFGVGVYSILVTFTRMTIASFSMSFVVSVFMFFIQNKRQNKQSPVYQYSIYYFALFVIAIIGLVYLQKQAGYQAFAFGILIFFASLIMRHRYRLNVLLISGLLIVFLFGAYGINDSIRDSRWHQDISSIGAVITAAMSSVILTIAGGWTGKLLRRNGLELSALTLPALIGIGMLVVIVGIGSFRMADRMQNVSADLQTRMHHWTDVIDSAQTDSLLQPFWGFGMGSMPKLYYQSHFDKMSLPSYRWNIEDGKTVFEIGQGDFPYYQKLSLEPDTNYTLTAMVKYQAEGGRLGLNICHRHILYSEGWQPDCENYPYRELAAGWQALEWHFNSGKLAANGWLDWPPTLHLYNHGDSIVAIDFIEIKDSSGRQIVKNSDFNDKLAHWFWGSDFEHLPWHSKQIFIQIWLEQGWIGLLLFWLLIGFGIFHQWTLFRAGSTIPIALVPATLAIFGLGLTDTFIDEPQTTLMTFGVLFAALQWPQSVKQIKSVR